jgi:NAD+ kinase
MKVVLFSRGDTSEVAAALDAAGIAWATHPDTDGADVAVSYGGDGTLLDCVRTLGHLPVLGVNSGRLGFLADVPREGMAEAFAALGRGEFTTEPRALIDVQWEGHTPPAYSFAFNDFTLQRGGTGMISVEAYIDGEQVATYWGDGVIVSTPAGSTAYSLSVGGPIVAPGCGCLLISPIAPHNLTMRPIVVPETSEIMLRMSTRDRYAYAALDDSRYEVGWGAAFRLRKADRQVQVVRLAGASFYKTLREKMFWGVDNRTVING